MTNSDDKSSIDKENEALWEAYTEDMRTDNARQTAETAEENFEELLNASEFQNHDDSEEGPPLHPNPSEEKQSPHSKQDMKKNNSTTATPQLDRRTEDKLKKGKIPIEARLDLHGFNQTQAHEKLNNFIIQSYHHGRRCVLVITGKGNSNKDSNSWLTPSNGVLKEKVPYWLSSEPLNKMVLKYMKAQNKDGGSGALYIYLKKKR